MKLGQVSHMQEVTDKMRNFLQFIALQFIKHPAEAELRVAEAGDDHVRFRLILNSHDVAILIGRNGFTASSIRSLLKAAAMQENITATLQIVSHEDERQRLAALEAGEIIEETDLHHEPEDESDDEKLEG